MFNKKPTKVEEQEAEALAEAVNKFKEFQDNVQPEEVKELKELSVEQSETLHQLAQKSDREVQAAPLKRGDSLFTQGKDTQVVEVLEPGRYHVKNKVFPFDSFIVLDSEINKPDLLVRPDNKYSL